MWKFSFVFSLNNFLKLKPVKLFYILQQNKKKKLLFLSFSAVNNPMASHAYLMTPLRSHNNLQLGNTALSQLCVM